MSAITAKASRKMKKYAVLTREPRCFLGSFDFSWEQRKLGELGTITTGNTPSTSIPDYYSDDGIVWVTPTDICENITFESARKLSDLGQQVGRVVPKNTILVTCIASIGKNTMLGNTGSFNQQINGLTPNENKYDPYFLLTESALWSAKMKGSAAAGTMQIVNRTGFSELKTWLPSLIEQQAIGAFFKQLDHLITLHQRECISFTARAGRRILTANKKRNTSSWEQRKFSDITFPAGEKNRDNLPLESYSITNEHGFVPQDEKFENGGTMREADKRMYYIVSPNSFAYNPARINVGSIGYQNIGKNVIVSSLYEVFKTSEDVDDRLLWHWFKSPDFQKLIMQLQEGGVRLYFYYDKLCMGEVSLPSLEEQRKIGKLFDTLDNLITLHQRKPFLMKWRTSDANRNKTNRLVL